WISPVQEQASRVENQMVRWLTGRIKQARLKLAPVAKKKGKSEVGATAGLSSSAAGDGAVGVENASNQCVSSTAGQATSGTPEPAGDLWFYSKSEHALVFERNGSRIEFHSAHNADNLRGAGLDLLVIDEAADVSEYAWRTVLKPMLLDAHGEALIIGTPRGTQHWLHRVFLRGTTGRENNPYESIALATSENPLIPKADIEEFRAEMSEDEFRQEFEAQFIDVVNTPFPRVDEAVA